MAADARAVAAGVLADVLRGKSLNRALPAALERVDARDRGLLQQLCYGSLRMAPRLLAILAKLLDKPLREKDLDIKALLLCGLYQIDATRIPDHAAVSATVAATGNLGKSWARGMCNAILRRYLRERSELCATLGDAAESAHPKWLYKAIRRQWPDHCDQIIAANNLQPPMTLRVNSRHRSRDEYLAQLGNAGLEASAGLLSPHAIYLASPGEVCDIPGFAAGLVSVQDEGAQLAALLLDAQAGDRVLDACAAPGGKSGHILEVQPGLSRFVAMDADPGRLQRVAENLDRLQLAAELIAGDATEPPAELEAASFDRILVDAPCSATGVIRRHPDIKLLRRRDDIAQLAAQQQHILEGLWPLLKPGGCLLYATCSILDEENSATISAFLSQHTDGSLLPLKRDWGEAKPCGRQIVPAPGGPDGLFYAMLRKAD